MTALMIPPIAPDLTSHVLSELWLTLTPTRTAAEPHAALSATCHKIIRMYIPTRRTLPNMLDAELDDSSLRITRTLCNRVLIDYKLRYLLIRAG